MYRGETRAPRRSRRRAGDRGSANHRRCASNGSPTRRPARARPCPRGVEHAAVAALLDRDAIADPAFRAAVNAIHRGDVAALARLLDAEPRLLRDRIAGPEVYRKRARPDYFRDPKLFWYVANNPTTVERVAPNIVAVLQTMLERGVEQGDLDYALELVMSSGVAREQGLQRPLMDALIDAGNETGAACSLRPDTSRSTHCAPCSSAACRSTRRAEPERRCGAAPATAGREPRQRTDCVGLAVINGHTESVRLALDQHVSAFLPIHSHSTALHDAAARNNVEMIAMLLGAGARRDILDTLWDGTPADWARHVGNAAASATLV